MRRRTVAAGFHNLQWRCVEVLAHRIRSNQFNNGEYVVDKLAAMAAAEDKINEMSNLELLELIEEVAQDTRDYSE